MSKHTKKTKPASRPPVDALQYEKLALSAFGACDRQIRQLETLINLAASITRCPATTVDERRRERNLMEHLLHTVERRRGEKQRSKPKLRRRKLRRASRSASRLPPVRELMRSGQQ